jgi:hypothetical protein
MKKTLGMFTVPHPNERVELAMQILECRQKLRQARRDRIEIEKLQAEMAVNPAVVFAIADRLSQPAGAWIPFHRNGWRSLIFPHPDR